MSMRDVNRNQESFKNTFVWQLNVKYCIDFVPIEYRIIYFIRCISINSFYPHNGYRLHVSWMRSYHYILLHLNFPFVRSIVVWVCARVYVCASLKYYIFMKLKPCRWCADDCVGGVSGRECEWEYWDVSLSKNDTDCHWCSFGRFCMHTHLDWKWINIIYLNRFCLHFCFLLFFAPVYFVSFVSLLFHFLFDALHLILYSSFLLWAISLLSSQFDV